MCYCSEIIDHYVTIVYNNKSVYIVTIYTGVIELDYRTLIVYVCIIQLIEYLEPELDGVMPNYTKMNICVNLCLVYIFKLYCISIAKLQLVIKITYIRY